MGATTAAKDTKAAIKAVTLDNLKELEVEVGLPNNKKGKILLINTKEYFDIQAYVSTGVAYPEDNDDFEKEYPLAKFTSLEKVDAGIWEDTRTTLTKISHSCRLYRDTKMLRLWQLPNTIISTARETVYYLKERPKSFQEQWKILQDPKYEDNEIDRAFERAQRTAARHIDNIISTYEDQSGKVNEVVQDLFTFASETSVNQDKVTSLMKRYNSPVELDGKTYENKKVFLNAELARLAEEIKQKQQEEQDKAKARWDWWGTKKWFNYFSWIPIVGFANLLILTPGEYIVWKEYEEKWKALCDKQAENKQVIALLETLGPLETIFSDIVGKMIEARKAMQELQKHFNAQIIEFETIKAKILAARKGIDLIDYEDREDTVEVSIDQACKVLKEVQTKASEFLVNSQMSIKSKEEILEKIKNETAP